MSKLLIQDHPLLVLPTLAKIVGLNKAILLQQIHYWLMKTSTVKDGRKWVYNTYMEWQAQLPFWSAKTIYRTLKSLEKDGYIFTATYNQHKMDQTKWYTINYEKIREFEQDVHIDLIGVQNDECCRTKFPPQDDNLAKAIPETTTKTTTDIRKDLYIPFAEIINYLNEKTNSTYKTTTNKTQSHLRARWQEGFRLEDFKKVIDIKTAEWLHDTYWKKYLRPETLFGPKFESYLNQQPMKNHWSEEDFDLDD